MKSYCYEEAGGERGEIYHVESKTEEEILEEHWDFWKELMEEKYGKDHPVITKDNCIIDWCGMYNAWEDTFESGS